MEINKNLIIWVISAIFSVILINLGIKIIEQNKYISWITILIAFGLIYIVYYALQIKTNKDDIEKIKEWIKNKEEKLNTMKDIVILKKVSKLK